MAETTYFCPACREQVPMWHEGLACPHSMESRVRLLEARMQFALDRIQELIRNSNSDTR